MLCDTCQKLFQGTLPPDLGSLRHHGSFAQLEQAASLPCYICTLLKRGIHRAWPDDNISDIPARAFFYEDSIRFRVMGSANKVSQELHRLPKEIYFGFQFYQCLAGSKNYSKFVVPHHISEETDSDTSMSCARTWMRECLQTHKLCSEVSSSTSNSRRPTRLLQIGMPGLGKLRLLVDGTRSDKNHQSDYLTLSHRWGSNNLCKLTSSTFSQLEQGLEIASLSKTFRRGIKVAQELNINLIWIDSLCIFKDSAKDWEREAPLMQYVYGGADCNISAIASENSETGCFFKRNPSQLKPYEIQPQWNCWTNGPRMLYYWGLWEDAISNGPLASRGWVFQELLLAPRILYLDDTQLFWQCHSLKACEAYPQGIPFSKYSEPDGRDALAALKLGTVGSAISSTNTKQLQLLWEISVRAYSKCSLTRPEDKLVAFSGVAKMIKQGFNDRYCAGLWRKHLPSQLLWHRSKEMGQFKPSVEYRAPSWAWASCDGPVIPGHFNDFNEGGIIIKILECDIGATNGDLTGQIQSGVLRIFGPLMRIELRQELGEGWRRPEVLIDRRWISSDRFSIFLDTDDLLRDDSRQIHCLLIRWDVDSPLGQSPFTRCLLLLPTGKLQGEFRRCGIMDLISGGIKDWKGFQNIRNHDWLQYETKDDAGKCDISII